MNPISASLVLILAAGAAAAPVGGDQVLVRVNGVPIRQSEVVERLLKRYGAQAVDEMIDETLREAAKKDGVQADDAEINHRVSKLEDQLGSREIFLAQLEQNHTSMAKVKEDISDEIVYERLVAKAKKLAVSDDEIKKAFDENVDKLGQPEALHLVHILVATDEQARDIVAKLKGGADFRALAREKSLAATAKTTGGDQGFVTRGNMPTEIDDAVFSMKTGDIKIIPSANGKNVFKVLERRSAVPAKFSEVKDDLRVMLLAEKIKKAAPSYIADLRSKADIKPGDAPATAAGVKKAVH